MNFHPERLSTSPPKGTLNKVPEQSVSLATDVKQPTLNTEHREHTGEDVHSFVIVNDIDVEEELTKAQKENKNFFKILSMSFYGRVKSHSLDTHEARDSQKIVTTPQDGLKSALPRKSSAHTPPESKRETFKIPKQKTQGALKKNAQLIKDLQITPEQFRKHLLTPKDPSIKIYSPVVVGKNYPMGTMSSKDGNKKESQYCLDSPHRAHSGKKTFTDLLENKKLGNNQIKTCFNTPSKDDISNKIRNLQKMMEQIEGKIQMTNIESSHLDSKLQDQGKTSKEQDRSSPADIGLKETKLTRKKSSRRDSSKGAPDKSTSANNSGRSLPSSQNSQIKTSSKELSDLKRFFLEQDCKPTTPVGMRSIKETETKPKKMLRPKTGSQETRATNDCEDSDNQDEKLERGLGQNEPRSAGKERLSSAKLTKEKSPATTPTLKSQGLPTNLGIGIGNWGIKPLLLPRDSAPSKPEHKEKRKESESLETKGKKASSQPAKKAAKSKTSSSEKLNRLEAYYQWQQMKKKDNHSRDPESPQPRFDQYKMKDDKTWKLFETYGKSQEERDKERAESPVERLTPKQFGLLNHLLVQNKREKL